MSELDSRLVHPAATPRRTTPGSGAQSIHTGSSLQTNATLSGGSHNTQYVAQTQIFYGPMHGGDQERHDALFDTDPAITDAVIDRDDLVKKKGEKD
ncbi:hypothetical protein LTR95_002946 [Oleoguttula sp. CCFEE 5521]